MKAVKIAAESFRENPEFNTVELLQQLGTGEALVSMLGADGVPGITQYARILPPESAMGTIEDSQRLDSINHCALADKYIETIDSDSAYEFLQRRQQDIEAANAAAAEAKAKAKEAEAAAKEAAKEQERAEKAAEKAAQAKGKAVETGIKNVASSTTGTIGREVGKAIGGTFGGSFGKTLGGNIGSSLGRNIIGTLFKLK